MIFSGSLLRWFPSRSALDGRNISRLLVLCFPESPDPLKSGMDWTSDWLRCLSKSAAHSFWPGDVTATVVTISAKKSKKKYVKICRDQKYRRSILNFDEILAMFSLSMISFYNYFYKQQNIKTWRAKWNTVWSL